MTYAERVRTDRERVELAFLPVAMLDVLDKGVSDPDNSDCRHAKALLRLSIRQVTMGLHVKTPGKISRRVQRTHEAVLAIYRREEALVAKVGLLVFYIVQACAECDYLVLGPESPFSQALDLIMPALEPWAENEKVNASAKRASTRAMQALHAMGLFEEVPIPSDWGCAFREKGV